jgi:hypothetical protein
MSNTLTIEEYMKAQSLKWWGLFPSSNSGLSDLKQELITSKNKYGRFSATNDGIFICDSDCFSQLCEFAKEQGIECEMKIYGEIQTRFPLT